MINPKWKAAVLQKSWSVIHDDLFAASKVKEIIQNNIFFLTQFKC